MNASRIMLAVFGGAYLLVVAWFYLIAMRHHRWQRDDWPTVVFTIGLGVGIVIAAGWPMIAAALVRIRRLSGRGWLAVWMVAVLLCLLIIAAALWRIATAR
jgi:hypothetical protein